MTKKIHKEILEITDKQVVMLPKLAEILCVQNQGGFICIWFSFLTMNENDIEPREIKIVGTGNPFEQEDFNYIGSVLQHIFVWHVFERHCD